MSSTFLRLLSQTPRQYLVICSLVLVAIGMSAGIDGLSPMTILAYLVGCSAIMAITVVMAAAVFAPIIHWIEKE